MKSWIGKRRFRGDIDGWIIHRYVPIFHGQSAGEKWSGGVRSGIRKNYGMEANGKNILRDEGDRISRDRWGFERPPAHEQEGTGAEKRGSMVLMMVGMILESRERRGRQSMIRAKRE